MPSKAYGTYKKNCKQVDKLLLAYTELRSPKRGRKHLDHLTRAAIIFLCSSWEVYIEQVTVEVSIIISKSIHGPDQLPERVRKTISNQVKKARHELEPINFASNWKDYYLRMVDTCVSGLNTPKRGQIREIFHQYIGIDGNITDQKVPMLRQVDRVVKTRGDIAHNLFAEDYVKDVMVKEYYEIISKAVTGIEIMLWDYLPEFTDGKRPWQNNYQV